MPGDTYPKFRAAAVQAAPVFLDLRSHPCVAGITLETRPLELKPDTRWARR